MQQVRGLASQGLELREKAAIKVRQPLSSFTVATQLHQEFSDILKDELNVKEIKVGIEVTLDTVVSPELKEEGILRELVRRVQNWRKEQGFKITDNPRYTMMLSPEEAAVEKKYRTKLLEATGLSDLEINTDA